MKKVLLIVLVSLFICSFAHSVEMDSKTFLSYKVENTTAEAQVFLVPITLIWPGRDRVIGWQITKDYDNTNNAEMYVEIYDASSASLEETDEVIDEAEYVTYDTNGRFFPYPRNVENGIVVRSGANTIVHIFFER